MSEKVVLNRPTRDQILMRAALLWSERSTCPRAKVGAIFSTEGRILVNGYNGNAPGMPHCRHFDDEPCLSAAHAEINGIAWAARNGIALKGSTLHVTVSPCLACARALVTAGIESVWYLAEHRETDGLSLLMDAFVAVGKMEIIDL